ncbi:PhzF family phenazine biosynthesis protein [Phenylobacterium sp.]|uniref:PhzF family phenazine biosynthesis protein n=1 Tax=Phenylobacterium sp. TaxID=1871053 RepID=UPI0035B41073
MEGLAYTHVDVFAPHPYAGNSLPVFLDGSGLVPFQMQAITRELRHFEAVFLTATGIEGTYRARVFDLGDELDFAGHPIIGAAAALHEAGDRGLSAKWTFELAARTVTVETKRGADGFFADLDQGSASFLSEAGDRRAIAQAFGLEEGDLDPRLPAQVVSTGLRYLIVPVSSSALARARIREDITPLLTAAGAEFAVLLDEDRREVRHWNNDGLIEDVATGSAAGTVGAYRLRYCGAESGRRFHLEQGRFTGRPSRIEVEPHGHPGEVRSVRVGGHVTIVGGGVLRRLP